MVGVLEELIQANKILEEVRESLRAKNIPFDESMEVGIMLEVPSAIFLLPKIAPEINFLSIGTNDLTQYLLALDRENSTVSQHFSSLHPAVLKALKEIINTAGEHNLDVSLCGELARNQKATQLLIDLGLRKFSMSSPAIPNIKDKIRGTSLNKKHLITIMNGQIKTLKDVESLIDG